ncbi:NAD-dependent succinate-semialdehyde dehydrogenase [Quadrisphaera sp. INWT6]|nr:NAD-dependent succinate-semialdehyde dehydrogenase [Quadrisphaera sp. INWT6]
MLAEIDPARGVLVGGRALAGGGAFPVDDPATLEVLAHVADGTAADATAAVDAAAAAFDGWRRTPPREPAEVLRRAFELLVRDADALAALVSAENGKSLADARGEVLYSAEFFRWYAEEAVRPHGDFGPSPAGGTRTVVTHRPVGVAALVTPWNFPAAMAARKIAPALAAGCTVVLKPAAQTPLTAIAVVRLLAEAGVPEGVVNLVPTTDPGEVVGTWLADARVRKLSFTGSTGVGRTLLRQAADRVVTTSMELGGNAPFVVLPGADVEAAVAGAMTAKFRGGGQACTAANRFYVHDGLAQEFTARFAAAVESLTVGPASSGAQVGPLISARERAGVEALVDGALAQGARVAARAVVPEGLRGHFVAPVLLVDVPADADVLTEEVFGPVAPVVVFDDSWGAGSGWDGLLARVNGTEMGLAAYVYGELGEALRFSEEVEAGMVGVNRGLVSDPSAPFGGVKQSGIGREGARAGVEEYLETQYLSVAW